MGEEEEHYEVEIVDDDSLEVEIPSARRWIQGESVREHLMRIAPLIVDQLWVIATNRGTPSHVRAKVLENLLQRVCPLVAPVDLSHQISEFDKMTDDEVKDWLSDYMRKLDGRD